MAAWPSRRLDPERVTAHIDRLNRAARALCRNSYDAEDLVQETYCRVLSRSRLLHRGDDLGYMLHALRNTHVDRIRRDGRRVIEIPLDGHELIADGDMRAPDLAVQANEVLAAIAALPSGAAAVLVAVDVLGLSYRETAARLGLKEATVTARLYRARQRVVAQVDCVLAP